MMFSLANLPYWILLGVGLVLFLLVIGAGGGEDGLDLEGDAEIDTDLEVEAEADLGLHLLGWLGIGQVPLMLLLALDFSLWGLLGWMGTVLLGEIGILSTQGIWAGGIFVGSLLLALLGGSVVARPMGRIFASFGEETGAERLIGRVGTVSSARIPNDGSIGQVDVYDRAHNLITISATLPKWATEIPQRGQEVLVIDHQTQSYVVISNAGSDRRRWLSDKSSGPVESV